MEEEIKHVTGSKRCWRLVAGWFPPVDWLHLPGDANNSPWRKAVEFLEKFPDVHPVLQVQVQLHDARQTWMRRRAERLERKANADMYEIT